MVYAFPNLHRTKDDFPHKSRKFSTHDVERELINLVNRLKWLELVQESDIKMFASHADDGNGIVVSIVKDGRSQQIRIPLD